LRGSAGAGSAKINQIVTALEAWDGRAEPSSLGLPLIVFFRSKLIEEVLALILEKCGRQDSNFKFEWANVDLPLQAIIKSGDTRLAPKRQPNGGWRDFLVGAVMESADELEQSYARPIARLSWGEINRANVAHPLSSALPLAAHILNLPADPLGGCPQCVRLHAVESGVSVGANMRMALSPGQESEGLIQMAGGQSGQFGSPH